MALGIYEDTGSLTFASTTQRDLEAVSYLLKKGVHLEIIPTFISRELDAQQVELLHMLLTSLTINNIHGVPVATASATTDDYVGELALLVHKMMDMENLNALIVMVRMEERVILVARSRLPELDVSRLAEEFGGGGHQTAASASIRELTLVQVQERLMALLSRMVGERVNAGSIMSSPVMTIADDDDIATAAEMMTHFNINSIPVIDDDHELAGIITRGVVERAILHGLGHSPVGEYMLTDFSTVTRDSILEEVQEYIIEKRQRMLPVMEKGAIVGVITRTDLLEAMHDDSRRAQSFEETVEEDDTPDGRVRNVRELLKEILDPKTLRILRTAGKVAEESGDRAYFVGGLVRDLILRRKNLDVDLVVEGDAIAYARKLARRLKARIRAHRKFQTAVIILPDGFKMDVASARAEYYSSPGEYPMVEPGSIKLDLYRRDFSINALAVKLNPDSFGQVVDHFNGLKDLKDRTIRILHNLSFVDDPTRIIRAVRFEQKFDFKIGKHTEYLMKGAIKRGYLRQAQGPRVLNEILVILRGDNPIKAFDRMEELGILRSLHPGLAFTTKIRNIFMQVVRINSWFQLLFLDEEPDVGQIYFNSLMMMKHIDEREQIMELFHMTDHQKITYRHRWEKTSTTMKELARTEEKSPSWIARLLGDVEIEDLLTIMSLTKREDTVKSISLYLSRLRFINREIGGKELQEMEYPSGPVYRDIMQAVQDARVDGIVNSLAEEKEWVKANFPVENSPVERRKVRGKRARTGSRKK
jgi:tRNA nucleotidyltransferase (CCA-adding enzyme)